MEVMINLGDKVRDNITGFTGIAIARTEWLHGCVRWIIQPAELREGKPIEPHTFDEPQLSLVEEHAVPNVAATPPTHGDRPPITRGHS